MEIIIDPDITAAQAHQVAVTAEHDLLHAIPRLAAALVHADPAPRDTDPHRVLADHHPSSVAVRIPRPMSGLCGLITVEEHKLAGAALTAPERPVAVVR